MMLGGSFTSGGKIVFRFITGTQKIKHINPMRDYEIAIRLDDSINAKLTEGAKR